MERPRLPLGDYWQALIQHQLLATSSLQVRDVQDEIPRGWKCDGVVSQIEPDGTLKPAGCGGAFPWWIPVVVGAGAAGAAITGGQDNPVSASRPAARRTQ